MTHPTVCEMEQAALVATRWDRWISAAEKRVGHDLDGDQDSDGYSLDGAFEAFRGGITPSGYAILVRQAKRARA